MSNNKVEQLINAIAVPRALSDRQVILAKKFVKERTAEGFTVGGFCKVNNLSTKTWYDFMSLPEFKAYLNEIGDAVIPTDEKEAYQKIKKKIMQIADKENPSIKEIELFSDTFAYVVENDKRERMEALGFSEDAVKSSTNNKTVEERKASLLSRLMGGNAK